MAIIAEGFITSKDIEIYFQPNGHRAVNDGADVNHVEKLLFDAAVDGGTFKLRVDGELTTAITFSATPATFVTSINAALDALESIGAGGIVASGTTSTEITLTATGSSGYHRIRLEAVALTDGGIELGASAVRRVVVTPGSHMIRLDAYASSFSWKEKTDTTDATPISQFAAFSLPTKSSATIDLSFYYANQKWMPLMVSDDEALEGRLYVYEQGNVAGRRYCVADVLFDSQDHTDPDHDKVEKSFTAVRQGAWVVPPYSVVP